MLRCTTVAHRLHDRRPGLQVLRGCAGLALAVACACAGDRMLAEGSGGSQGETAASSGGGESTPDADATGVTDGGVDSSTSGAAADVAPSSDALVVLTVNLRTPLTSPRDVEQRTQIVADLILALEPDVVALQEVTKSDTSANRAEVLADLTGYEWRWSQTHDLVYAEGVGMLSRWPIAWDEALELPHPDLFGASTRKVLGIGATTPLGEVAAYSTHMTLDEDETVRADQAVAAWHFVDERRTALPGALAGDTNATPETLAMQVLRGEATHDGVTGDLVDGWAAANPDDPGFTFPSDAPERRIDYVYAIAGTRAAAVVEGCERHLARPQDGVMASDHLAVSCRLRIAAR
jgi:endonuclease/exonuclease/phosphatase family metal-dependent hydrolase